MNCKIIRRRWKLLPAIQRASNCCQNYHQGSILLSKTIFFDSIKHICEECKEGSPKCPKVRSTLENWSLTRVSNPWDKYIESKHCWALFWNRHKYLSVLYPNIYSLHQQASQIERSRGCKNLWRWNVERIMAIKEPNDGQSSPLIFFKSPIRFIESRFQLF